MVLKAIIIFAAGVYSGIYIDQNYKIARVDDPSGIWRKVREFAAQYETPSSVPRVDEPKEIWKKVNEFIDQYKKPPS